MTHIHEIMGCIAGSRTLRTDPNIQPLTELLEMIIKDFMVKLSQFPMLFIEILFTKNSYDCKYIELGEDPIEKSMTDPMNELKVFLCVDPIITELRDQLALVATRLIEKSQGFMLDWAVEVCALHIYGIN
jgi:hypothetical protein